MFITFEGLDGSGKSTQIRRLVARLRALGREVVETAEPGGTPIGRQIRAILLSARNRELRPAAELFLYLAARAQSTAETIAPALARGEIVLSDRFTDSTLAYQGCGRGLGAAEVQALARVSTGGLEPRLTLLLDIDVATSLARARGRNRDQASTETRMDEQSAEFYQRVRDAYLALARAQPERIRVIDALPDSETVERRVWEAVEPHV
ncbi:MAG: dTMP kinase [Acidobacteria bacterium]|nr:dTMP kinase [Acidobacteriota bacterium]